MGNDGGGLAEESIRDAWTGTRCICQLTHNPLKIIVLLKIAYQFQNTDIVYRITKGNELKKFGLVKRHGVWSLHFRKRLKNPETFLLEIEGRIPRLQATNGTYEKPLKLFINLEVTQLPS